MAGKKNKGGAAKDAAPQGQAKSGPKLETKGAQWVKARHILCDKESQKNQALEKLKLLLADSPPPSGGGGGGGGRAKRGADPDEFENLPWGIQQFYMVAKEFSQDKPNQGGLISQKSTKGSLMPEFEAVAFFLAKSGHECHYGEAKTSEGYHIIIVQDRG